MTRGRILDRVVLAVVVHRTIIHREHPEIVLVVELDALSVHVRCWGRKPGLGRTRCLQDALDVGIVVE